MRAAIFRGPKDVVVGERPDPVIGEPTDAVVRVVLACVCGSDLWYYRGESEHAVGSIGHEFVGVVEEVGTEVSGITRGDLVVAPFIYSDMTLPALSARLDDQLPRRWTLRRRHRRWRSGRGGSSASRLEHPRAGAGSGTP